MSDHFPLAEPLRAPALALARWTALLTGWVWLGAQGQRLGWSLASGLLAVALWWALRLVLDAKGFAPSRRWVLAAGLATAAGAGWVAQAEVTGASLAVLMVLAGLWAVWSIGLESLAAGNKRCQRPWAGWPPVVAALLAWGSVSPSLVSVAGGAVVSRLLLALVVLVWVSVPRVEVTHRSGNQPDVPQLAMGLMMGSLWLSGGWCANIGWSIETVVGLHLALMAVLPGLVRLDGIPNQMPSRMAQLVPLAMVAAGGGLLAAGFSPANGLVGMLLLALAWALPRGGRSERARGSLRERLWGVAPLAGPALLIAVGAWSPTMGPQALAMAYGGIAALAGARLLMAALAPWMRRSGPQQVRQRAK